MRNIADQIKPALRTVSKRNTAYFLKREVVHEVLRRADIADAVIEIRRTYRGKGLDDAILGYVDTQVGAALRQRDALGIRLFECYADANGERRWKRFATMRMGDVRRVVADLQSLRDRLDEKLAVYEVLLAELEQRGGDATVEDVYDVVVTRSLALGLRLESVAS